MKNRVNYYLRALIVSAIATLVYYLVASLGVSTFYTDFRSIAIFFAVFYLVYYFVSMNFAHRHRK